MQHFQQSADTGKGFILDIDLDYFVMTDVLTNLDNNDVLIDGTEASDEAWAVLKTY